MILLAKFKIRTKLAMLIIFMVCGILTVGIVGYYYNNKAKNDIASLYKENLLPIQLLNDARTNAIANKTNILELMLASDAPTQNPIKDDIGERKKTIDNDLTLFEKTSLDSFESQNYTLLKANLAKWNDFLDKSLTLSTSGKSAEAYAMYRSTGNAVFEEMQTNLRDLVTYNSNQSEEINNKNNSDYENVTFILIIIITLVIVIAIIFGLIIYISITKPMSKLTVLINKTSRFDLASDTSFDNLIKYKNETGVMVKALADMRKALREMAREIITISGSLLSHSEELSATTEENTKTIGQVVTTINEIAKGNSSQAEMVNKTTSAISDFMGKINTVNSAITESAINATESLAKVEEGQKAVDLATQRMQENVAITQEVGSSISELSESIVKVNSIVNVITSIAEQTNLLALNAAIEAARAGEAGKGFAVVSEEIRKLAEGSSSAAKEITKIIKDTTEKSKQAAGNMNKAESMVNAQKEAVNTTKEAFDKIKLSVDGIVKQVKQSAGTLQSIDAASKEILSQTQDMAAIAEQSAAGTEEISASSEEQLASIETIAQAASELSGMAEELNNEIRKFKI